MAGNPDDKVLYGVVTPDGGPLTIILGVPAGAWEYMRDSTKAHKVDLSEFGIPVKIVLYGGKDAADVLSRAQITANTADMRSRN